MASVRVPNLIGAATCLIMALGLVTVPAKAAGGDISFLSSAPKQSIPEKAAPDRNAPVTGILAPSLFYYPVVAQPADNFAYVSTAEDTVTQFGLAWQFGNVGLLAHNFLAGKDFFNLSVGQPIYLLRGEKQSELFVIKAILRYQALNPSSPYSDFRDTETGETLSATQMFTTAYGGAYHLTLQTCIEQDGNSSWGRLFVIAEPLFSAAN